jgi:hypothetical protein
VASVLSVTTRLASRRVSSSLVESAGADGKGTSGGGMGLAWAAFTQAAMPSRRIVTNPKLAIGSAPSTAARSRS